jgi:hypothetical protein
MVNLSLKWSVDRFNFIDHLLSLRHALYDSSLLTTDHTDRVDNDTELVYLSDCTDLLSIVHKVM